MIEIKDIEGFKKNANKIIEYLDNDQNFYAIRKKEPDLIKWFERYGTLIGFYNKELNELLVQIYLKRKVLNEKEKSLET